MKILIVSLFLLSVGFAEEAISSTFSLEDTVSMTALIANPDAYNDKEVMLIGVAKFEVEGGVLCDSKEHLESRVTKNCVWLKFDKKYEQELIFLQNGNGKYFIVGGTVDSKDLGKEGLNSATIEKITLLDRFER